MEVRKQNSQQYLPMTIQHYLIGLQHYIRNQKGNALNFMVDIEFLCKLLDALCRRLPAQRKQDDTNQTRVLINLLRPGPLTPFALGVIWVLA